MKDSCDKTFVKQPLSSVRRLMETVIAQLSERFHIEKIRVREFWHTQNCFIHKLFSHTVGVFLKRSHSQQFLQFEALVQV